MIKVFITVNGYDIEVDGKPIVKCNKALIPFKELLIHLGYDLSKYTVQIMDNDCISTNDAEENINNIDDVISDLNNKFKSPNLGKYREVQEIENEDDSESDFEDHFENSTDENKSTSNEPVGNVECPNTGDLIYVDGLDGVLCKITGGVGTVMTLYKNASEILLELEEVPGNYFSWNLLKNSQDHLKQKYGYKPVCKI